MLIAGSLSGGDWVEAQSLARAIEDAMIAGGVIDMDAETEDATTERRKTFIAIATGIVTHLTSNATLSFATGSLGTMGNPGDQLPAAAVSLTGRVS